MSRAELIKQARENCNRTLNGKPQPSNTIPKREQAHIKKQEISSNQEKKEEEYAAKPFMIRSIIAILLFLCILCMGQLELEYEGITVSNLKQYLQEEQTLTTIKEQIVQFTKEQMENFRGKTNP